MTLAEPAPPVTHALVVTGPIPLQASLMDARAIARRLALIEAGCPIGVGVRYFLPTASVIWDGIGKRAWIAVEDDVDPGDWKQVMSILRMTGWMNGSAGYDDIGEPGYDPANRVWLWNLPCP